MIRSIATAATVLALAGSALLPATAPAQAAPLPPPTISTAMDVDGDGLVDTVELFKMPATRYLIQVTTATRISGVFFNSTYPGDWGEPDPWFGAAKLDKAKGYELMVYRWGGDGVGFTVYTWRSGRLVAEKAPAAPLVSGWYLGGQGYRFFDSKGKRYVDVSALAGNTAGTIWTGKVVRSVWKSDHWAKLSTRKVKLSTAKANAYIGFNGVTILK